MPATGEPKWEVDAQLPVQSGPMSFEIDGEQYIAGRRLGLIAPACGRHGYGSAILRRADHRLQDRRKATLPPYDTFPPDPVRVGRFRLDCSGRTRQGSLLPQLMVCHGDGAQSAA